MRISPVVRQYMSVWGGFVAAPSLAARAVALKQSASIDYTGMCGYDYVEDAARAIVWAAFKGPVGAHVVDLPSEQARPADIVSIFQEIDESADVLFGGLRIPSNRPTRDTPITRLIPDWQTTTLRDGLRKTVEFYRN